MKKFLENYFLEKNSIKNPHVPQKKPLPCVSGNGFFMFLNSGLFVQVFRRKKFLAVLAVLDKPIEKVVMLYGFIEMIFKIIEFLKN